MAKNVRLTGSDHLPLLNTTKKYLDLVSRKSAKFVINFAPLVSKEDYLLTVDIYSVLNHAHPQGHIGWWDFPLKINKRVKVEIRKARIGFKVIFQNSIEAKEKWVNEDYQYKNESTLVVHLVLRDKKNKEKKIDHCNYLYAHKATVEQCPVVRQSADKNLARRTEASRPMFSLPRDCSVHIVTSDLQERDAIGNFALSLYRFFKLNKINCRLYANIFSPVFNNMVQHASGLFCSVKKLDIVIINFSTYDPFLEDMSSLTCKKILYYSGITPPTMFRKYDINATDCCLKAYRQLRNVKKFDAYFTNSKFIARDLRRTLALNKSGNAKAEHPEIFVLPPFLDMAKWKGLKEASLFLPKQRNILLHVGRLVPNKKIEDLIFLYHEYQKLDSLSILVLVGKPLMPKYREYLGGLLEGHYRHLKDGVFFLSDVSDGQLKKIYKQSSAFISMSEHEGFCIPLVEAMYFRKPAFAFAQEAMKETLGSGGRVFYKKDFSAIAAEINSVLKDRNELEKILKLQDKRFKEILSEANGEPIWRAIKTALLK